MGLGTYLVWVCIMSLLWAVGLHVIAAIFFAIGMMIIIDAWQYHQHELRERDKAERSLWRS